MGSRSTIPRAEMEEQVTSEADSINSILTLISSQDSGMHSVPLVPVLGIWRRWVQENLTNSHWSQRVEGFCIELNHLS
jgi:hypothetical protein